MVAKARRWKEQTMLPLPEKRRAWLTLALCQKCLAGSGGPIAAQIFLDSSSLAPSFFLLTPAHPGTVVGDFRAYPVSPLGGTCWWILAWLEGGWGTWKSQFLSTFFTGAFYALPFNCVMSLLYSSEIMVYLIQNTAE